MIKLKTGISTSLDFVKAMKERGQDVSPAFPAATLRDQLDELSEEVKVTFNSNNETVLQVINDYEESDDDDDSFDILLKYSTNTVIRQDSLEPDIVLLPSDLEPSEEFFTYSEASHGYVPTKGIRCTLEGTEIPLNNCILQDSGEQGYVLKFIPEGDILNILLQNGGSMIGLTIGVEADAGAFVKGNTTSNEFSQEFEYGQEINIYGNISRFALLYALDSEEELTEVDILESLGAEVWQTILDAANKLDVGLIISTPLGNLEFSLVDPTSENSADLLNMEGEIAYEIALDTEEESGDIIVVARPEDQPEQDPDAE